MVAHVGVCVRSCASIGRSAQVRVAGVCTSYTHLDSSCVGCPFATDLIRAERVMKLYDTFQDAFHAQNARAWSGGSGRNRVVVCHTQVKA